MGGLLAACCGGDGWALWDMDCAREEVGDDSVDGLSAALSACGADDVLPNFARRLLRIWQSAQSYRHRHIVIVSPVILLTLSASERLSDILMIADGRCTEKLRPAGSEERGEMPKRVQGI